ncbi:MAG: hypothetical protein CM1200mP26_09200 [Acidimicrobiales bacterium]|nr:MAG: hypothetical protein CM1200mP26_09200 [Acidimicrobiales bacterium]
MDASGDLWDEVTGGRAVVGSSDPIRCRIGSAAGALIVPLPHRTAFRFAVPAGDLIDNPSAVLPSADRVAAGWVNRLEGAATVDLPDGIDAHAFWWPWCWLSRRLPGWSNWVVGGSPRRRPTGWSLAFRTLAPPMLGRPISRLPPCCGH